MILRKITDCLLTRETSRLIQSSWLKRKFFLFVQHVNLLKHFHLHFLIDVTISRYKWERFFCLFVCLFLTGETWNLQRLRNVYKDKNSKLITVPQEWKTVNFSRKWKITSAKELLKRVILQYHAILISKCVLGVKNEW